MSTPGRALTLTQPTTRPVRTLAHACAHTNIHAKPDQALLWVLDNLAYCKPGKNFNLHGLKIGAFKICCIQFVMVIAKMLLHYPSPFGMNEAN